MNPSHIGIAGIYHLVFFGLLMPWSAVKSARRLKQHSYPPRRKYFLMVIGQQCFFLLLSSFVAAVEWIEIWTLPRNHYSYLIAAAVLALLIAVMIPYWRRAVEMRERRVYLFMARDKRERALWVVISFLAGIGEEITYRGVLFLLLLRLTGHEWLAALLAAMVFGISHYVQGWRNVFLIAVFALLFQLIYHLSGSLLLPMAMHFLYDVTAGVMYGYFGNKLGYPAEGFPPESQSELAAQGAE